MFKGKKENKSERTLFRSTPVIICSENIQQNLRETHILLLPTKKIFLQQY